MIAFVTNILETVPATILDWRKLAQYHYKPESPGTCTNIYKVIAKYPHSKSFPDPLACVCYHMPLPRLRSRNRATNGFFRAPKSQSNRMKLVNTHVRYLTRIVVDPRFQRLGIATKLLEETLPLQNVTLIEALTPIDPTNLLFKKAGFVLYFNEAPLWYRRFVKALMSIGLDAKKTLLPTTLQKRLRALKEPQKSFIENEITQFLHQFKNRQHQDPTLDRSKYIISKLSYPQAYLLWYNEKKPISGLN